MQSREIGGTGTGQAAKKDADSKTAQEDATCPQRCMRIDACNQVFKTAMKQGHVKHLPGLGQGIQIAETVTECRKILKDSMTRIGCLQPSALAEQHRLGHSLAEGAAHQGAALTAAAKLIVRNPEKKLD
jgi:hypothetical protein